MIITINCNGQCSIYLEKLVENGSSQKALKKYKSSQVFVLYIRNMPWNIGKMRCLTLKSILIPSDTISYLKPISCDSACKVENA